jgi:dienelactone hydrolase
LPPASYSGKVPDVRALSTISAALLLGATVAAQQPPAPATTGLLVRGKSLTLHLYGPPNGDPVVVSSGDGGWMHLGPHAAGVLARAGFFVVGVDSKNYLSAFTSGKDTLRAEDVQMDFATFVEFASRRSRTKPILVGVSEGAGLSVLAAAGPQVRPLIRGVIGLGLPDINELGWRWSDSVIYFTKGTPNEPTFSVKAMVDRVAPLPLAAIHATHDEFVPLAEIKAIMARAQDPKRLWVLEASDHRFSDNEREFDKTLLEAMAWVATTVR